MQGRKGIQPKMMYQVILDDLVSPDNFYRKLNSSLDLSFIYAETVKYYGNEGQESIDPVVFFKICLAGYLNNINSDKKLIEYCSNCLDIRLYIQYDIDESLPWHSTISRTRQLYGEEVFLSLFQKVLSMCVQKGMVRGKRQAIDSAFIKANASLDSLLEKEIIEDVATYANELNDGSEFKIKTSEVTTQENPVLKIRPEHTNKSENTDERGNLIRGESLSNKTHFSPTDPDSRISVKPGKPRLLNYYGQIAVDDANHVITGAIADFADKKDSECLPKILKQTIDNLKQYEIQIQQICADTAYSSGSGLHFVEENGIDGYIPNHGSYKPIREGFFYNEKLDQWECQRGNMAILKFKNIQTDGNGYKKKKYMSSEMDCRNCQFSESCLSKSYKAKKIEDSIDKPYYDRMHKKMQTEYAKRIVKIRSKTVEPVLGTLINFMNMKRVNSRGIKQANKHVLMASLCYNLKKYLRFKTKNNESLVLGMTQKLEENLASLKTILLDSIQAILRRPNLEGKITHSKISLA